MLSTGDVNKMNANNQKILVTGAAGLIGSRTVMELVDSGFNVFAMDNFSIGTWRESSKNVQWVKLDICDENLIDRLDEMQPQQIVHCAAHPGGLSLKEPALNVKVNAHGSMRLFEWCARNDAKVLYLSSSVIYGDQPVAPIKESAEVHPGTVYGVCKVACESFLKVLQEGYGLRWIVLRPFATYGAGHQPNKFQGIANIMLTQLMEGNRVVVKGSLQRQRDLVYVDDVAAAIRLALQSPDAQNDIFNIGLGSGVSILELIKILASLLNYSFADLQIIEEEGTVGDPAYNVADISKANKSFHYQPGFTLEAGLSRLVQHRLQTA